MKNKLNILVAVFAFFTFSVNAQVIKKVKKRVHPISSTTNNSNTTFEGCDMTLASKDGVVYSVNPGYLTTVARSNKVTVSIKKTGGRAKTIVNIYAGNQLKKRIIFENGDYKTTKQRVLNNVKNKKIKVEIVNQSVGNTFKYTAKINGKDIRLTPDRKAVTGNLGGQFEKNVRTRYSCTGKVRVIVKRTGGTARATLLIFEGTKTLKSVIFERNQNTKNFILNANSGIKIKLKNISIGNVFKYKINAYAIQ